MGGYIAIIQWLVLIYLHDNSAPEKRAIAKGLVADTLQHAAGLAKPYQFQLFDSIIVAIN